MREARKAIFQVSVCLCRMRMWPSMQPTIDWLEYAHFIALQSAQGRFDSEILKLLGFYAERRDAILEEVRGMQRDVDAVPADIMENEALEPNERLRRIDELTKRLQVSVSASFRASANRSAAA